VAASATASSARTGRRTIHLERPPLPRPEFVQSALDSGYSFGLRGGLIRAPWGLDLGMGERADLFDVALTTPAVFMTDAEHSTPIPGEERQLDRIVGLDPDAGLALANVAVHMVPVLTPRLNRRQAEAQCQGDDEDRDHHPTGRPSHARAPGMYHAIERLVYYPAA